MSDIELRLGRDMLVLSAPIDAALARQGIDAARDRQYLNLFEPDAIADALRMEMLAGAQCLVTTTEDITRARLAHLRMEDDPIRLAQAAVSIAVELKPQHLLAEIGPCGLPLDCSSKSSLNENRAQYADAARAFDGCDIDAFFLNGFASIPDLKCALMGLAQVSGKSVFVSMKLGKDSASVAGGVGVRPQAKRASENALPEVAADEGKMYSLGLKPFEGPLAPAVPQMNAVLDPELWPEALDTMVDLGATVVGFETADPLDAAVRYAKTAVEQSGLPVLAQVRVAESNGDKSVARTNALTPIEDRTDYAIETMEHVAAQLYNTGVQFLRAAGAATPAYTGALAATVAGMDVRVL